MSTNEKSPSKSKYRPYVVRLLIVTALSVVFTIIFNETAFMMQKDESDRAPTTLPLVIPKGTAEQVAAGQAVPSIPEEMVFVLGDVLEVKNEDVVSHQLGPLWVPAGATGRMVMDKAEDQVFSCSFQPSKYLGLDVRQPTTLSTRLTGLLLAAPTTTILVFLYSLLMFPLDKKKPGRSGPAVGT